MDPQLPPDVTSLHSTCILDCVQVVHYYISIHDTDASIQSWVLISVKNMILQIKFPKKPIGEMSEKVRLFDAVNGTGIVNSYSEFLIILFVLHLISALHTPKSSV